MIFSLWPPVAQIKVVATFLLSVWQENNFVNKMLTFCAFLSSVRVVDMIFVPGHIGYDDNTDSNEALTFHIQLQ